MAAYHSFTLGALYPADARMALANFQNKAAICSSEREVEE